MTTRAEQRILDEAYDYVCDLICNQALYQLMPEKLLESNSDAHYLWRDDVDYLTTKQTNALEKMIRESVLCDRDCVVPLIATMTLEELYDEDGWVDSVADYIHKNRKKCGDLIRAKGKALKREHEV